MISKDSVRARKQLSQKVGVPKEKAQSAHSCPRRWGISGQSPNDCATTWRSAELRVGKMGWDSHNLTLLSSKKLVEGS